MAERVDVTSELNEAWRTLNTYWRDETANAFYRRYHLPMGEAVSRFDSACMELDDLTDRFSVALDRIRSHLYD